MMRDSGSFDGSGSPDAGGSPAHASASRSSSSKNGNGHVRVHHEDTATSDNPFEGASHGGAAAGGDGVGANYAPADGTDSSNNSSGLGQGLASARQFASGMLTSFQSHMPEALSSMQLPSSRDINLYIASSARAREAAAASAENGEGGSGGLHKVLDWKDLISLGVGCTIGAGIFVVTGVVAATKAGPALFLCYIVSGIACALAGLCYSELAAMAPSAGSAYSYARASMGQTVGWIIGWDLTLEYAVSGASVAQGWSKYSVALLKLLGIGFPSVLSSAPWAYDANSGHLYSTGALLDLPAMLITLAITWLLVRGMRESARFAKVMVVLKIAIVVFVILAGVGFMHSENFSPFMPYGFFGISFFGHTAIGQSGPDGSPVGVFAGAAIVFFAYIGFDTVTCQAEETKNPQRDLPIGIIGSLAISTVLYVAVSIVLVGMVPYNLIDLDAPLSNAFGQLGMHWAEFIIAIGAIVGITSVLLVTLMGQPRIMLSMARDGLLPESFFTAVHPVYGTPHKSTILTGAVVSLLASLIPLSVLVELVSIGTLLAFTIVCIAILVLRKSAPDVHRPFLCPGVPYVPVVGACVCALLMLSLPSSNWVRLILWLALGMAVYVLWGHKNAKRVMEVRMAEARAHEAAGEEGGAAGGGREARLAAAASVEMAGGGRRIGNADADALLLDPPSSISFSRNIFEQQQGSGAAGAGGVATDSAEPSALGAEEDHDDEDDIDHSALRLPSDAVDDEKDSAPASAAAAYVSPSAAARQARAGLLRRDEEEQLSDDVELR